MCGRIIEEAFADALRLHQALMDEGFISAVSSAADAVVSALRNGGKVLVAGNGGSAADAQHFVAEIVGRFQKERRGLPAIALSTNTSSLTAIANDYAYDDVFARQVEALGRKGDIFFGISTSGNSPNIVKALEAAKGLGIFTVGLLGKGGGKCKDLCDIAIVVPHNTTARIQEVHILVIHAICAVVDESF